MAVPSSGAITLGKIYQEIDGSGYSNAVDPGEEASLEDMSSNDTPDSLNSNSTNRPNETAPHSMSEFHGYDQSAVPPFSWGTMPTVPQSWGNISHTNAFTALALAGLGFAFQPADNRVRIRYGNGTGSSMLSYSYVNLPYTGNDPASCEFSIAYNGFITGSTTSNSLFGGHLALAYHSMATQSSSSDSGSFTSANTFIQKTSGSGSAAFNALGANSPQWTIRAKNSSGTVIGTSSTSAQNSMSLTITRGNQGGGEFFCIHVDMLVDTADGPMSIIDVFEKDPKVWSYNWDKKQKELVDQEKNIQVMHKNLYIINNDFKLTEDHIMYGEDGESYSINPENALKKYGNHSQELKVGNKLRTLSGDKYLVNDIKKLEGEHMTYTISNRNKNFYANNILVDSEV